MSKKNLLSPNATKKAIADALGNGVVSISSGNSKTGPIWSVSVPPFTTCPKDAPCFKTCYTKHIIRFDEPTAAYNKNLAIYLTDPNGYFNQIRYMTAMCRFFRWHIAGDIVDPDYFKGVVYVAKSNPGCNYLIFTKQYKIVNDYINENPDGIPKNLTVVFSNWFTWHCQNPHNLPVTEIYNDGDIIPDNWKICGGNCFECCCRGIGCWELKKGEILAFKKH